MLEPLDSFSEVQRMDTYSFQEHIGISGKTAGNTSQDMPFFLCFCLCENSFSAPLLLLYLLLPQFWYFTFSFLPFTYFLLHHVKRSLVCTKGHQRREKKQECVYFLCLFFSLIFLLCLANRLSPGSSAVGCWNIIQSGHRNSRDRHFLSASRESMLRTVLVRQKRIPFFLF